MTVPLLRTEHLTKAFGDVIANADISFAVNPGEIHCLLGENGAGKSTLSECIYGYYRPDHGSVYFKGQPVSLNSPHDAIKLGIGMVHQHFNLVDPLSVLENIIVGSDDSSFLLDTRSARARIESLCESYDLTLNLDAPVGQLSVGEQQWVEILKALYLGAELLILDEPTAVLTPRESARLFDIMRQITREGRAIILITHKLDEVLQSDRVTVLRKGRVTGSARVENLTKEDLTQMMIGRRIIETLAKVVRQRGAPVLEVHKLSAQHDRGHSAIQDLSFTLHRNEILGLAGVAGNGQRELFEVLVGVRPPSAGRVILDGEDVTGADPAQIMAKGVGHIPGDRIKEGLIGDLSIAENLILGEQGGHRFSRWGKLLSSEISSHADRCIEDFGIATPSGGVAVKTLSGGNAQKVIVARELGQSRKCLLSNQATRGLDVGVIGYVHEQILEKRAEGYGILYASEEIDELFALCDRIAVIFKGRIVDIVEPNTTTYEYVGQLMAGHDPSVIGRAGPGAPQ